MVTFNQLTPLTPVLLFLFLLTLLYEIVSEISQHANILPFALFGTTAAPEKQTPLVKCVSEVPRSKQYICDWFAMDLPDPCGRTSTMSMFNVWSDILYL